MKADERRGAIIDRLADHVLAHGLAAASLRALAAAAATSDRMLLYYFKDKAEIIGATLACVAARMRPLLDAAARPEPQGFTQLRDALVPLLFDPAAWPYLRVWLELASRSAAGDPIYRAVGEAIGRGFLAWGTTQLAGPTPAARAATAAKLLVTIEGMVVLKSLGLDDAIAMALD